MRNPDTSDPGAELLRRAEGLSGKELEELVTDGCAHALCIERDLLAARRVLEEKCEAIAEPGGEEDWQTALDHKRSLESELASVRRALDEMMAATGNGFRGGGGRFKRDPRERPARPPGLGSPPRA